MDLRRALTHGPANVYNQAVRDVLGPPGGADRPDTLALTWAHKIAWAAHGSPALEELEQLSNTALRYEVPLYAVLDERRHQQQAAPIVPAHRPASKIRASARKLSRPA